MEQNTLPKTFVDLYLLGCRMLNDEPEHKLRYKDLDILREYIEGQDESTKKQYLHAINDNRTCVVMPYKFFSDKRRPPDDTIDGIPVICACPEYDKFISNLIDQLLNAVDDPQVTAWKLRILSKMYRLGWDAYCTQYIEPLKEKELYIRKFVSQNRKT